ncbi:MAG TPA: DUF1178 family protein [Xanthobacteraceae bacterium]|jgi:hypothetical protein
MIRYALNCDQGHNFESWFASSSAFDKQAKRGLVTCPICGSAKVEKAIMAPNLAANLGQSGSADPRPPTPTPPAPPPPLQPAPMPPIPPKTPVAMVSAAERELRHKLKELRDHITKNARYVGPRFPEEARKIHYGEAEHSSIYGEASPEEAKQLHEEGIEFHPLPILPDDKN